MNLNITAWTEKGGAGKTPISANIALDNGHAIGTNEASNYYEPRKRSCHLLRPP